MSVDRLRGVVDPETVTAVFDAVDAALDVLVDLSFDALTTPEWLALVERCESYAGTCRWLSIS
ncbi:hypothetical protein PJH48_00090 [Mycobacterium kansasii]|uniref:Uncharacterized protein n=1 Tax=Mycobacterium kansasii TaxID=1768 RepID=A0A653F389_MYCKA|nr:hypothetical protein [Mycobacterium kansasii]VAZ61428.1 hypothetical protein LAUMK22_03239 [Mycobacterium kansasii]VAZ67746.1 hypothetical protein LAUMK40_03887 [Mycobacterium kansasii]VAZ77389.1 hypothetical protein LAUMK7_03860 [Mycobacterium kansasii]VTP03631.1 hypothetical protein BIN_B_04009 [Mycobacterium kansasii]GFP49700.1 hypothetical protein MKANGN_35780 [Mycobacterium kansasii]